MNTGPNTEEGKLAVSQNAIKHGVFVNSLSQRELIKFKRLKKTIREEEGVKTTIERMILDRVAWHFTKLNRISKMERDYIKSILNQKVTVNPFGEDTWGEKVIKEGYEPSFNNESVTALIDIYSRYETTEENKLYRAINQLLNIKASQANK